MAWFETPTLQEFKDRHYDFDNDCWKHPSDGIAYKVLDKMPSTEIRPKTAHQEKKEAKENEIKKAIKDKEKWEE